MNKYRATVCLLVGFASCSQQQSNQQVPKVLTEQDEEQPDRGEIVLWPTMNGEKDGHEEYAKIMMESGSVLMERIIIEEYHRQRGREKRVLEGGALSESYQEDADTRKAYRVKFEKTAQQILLDKIKDVVSRIESTNQGEPSPSEGLEHRLALIEDYLDLIADEESDLEQSRRYMEANPGLKSLEELVELRSKLLDSYRAMVDKLRKDVEELQNE